MPHTIAIKNLTYKWPGQEQNLLEIEELAVKEGERLFLMGASGSGKSTLLSLLGGVIVPQQGSIEILGNDITSLKAADRDEFRANHMGYIFQQFNLVPYLSVLENVTLPCRFSSKRYKQATQKTSHPNDEASRLLDQLGLSGKYKNKAVTELSVGQQQRVAAARAVIGSPEIIIADEPTSSLDANAQESFIDLLFKECETQKTSLVFVSHDERFAKLFDRTIEIESLSKQTVQGGAI